jgi:hypothetical protein
MTNTGKLLIIGLLVIDAGIAGYLLYPKDEERAPTASGVVVGSIDDDAQDVGGGSARVAGGGVMSEPAEPVAPPSVSPAAGAQALAQAGAQADSSAAPSARAGGNSVPQQPAQYAVGSVPAQPVQSSVGSLPGQPATGSAALSSLPPTGPVPQPSSRSATSFAPATTTAIAPAPAPCCRCVR